VRFTRAQDLLLTALIAGVVVYLLIRPTYGSVPPLPRLAGVTLLALAVAETAMGFGLRARIQRKPGTRPVQPLQAARAVALAKASSLLGAVMGGAWLGVLGYVFPLRAEVTAAASDMVTALIGVGCAAALIAAALWLEYCCKTPKGPDDLDTPNGRT